MTNKETAKEIIEDCCEMLPLGINAKEQKEVQKFLTFKINKHNDKELDGSPHTWYDLEACWKDSRINWMVNLDQYNNFKEYIQGYIRGYYKAKREQENE